MNILYAPWREKYINDNKSPAEEDFPACVFCKICNLKIISKKEFVLFRTESIIVVLNIYPYNSGHLLLVPVKHMANLDEFSLSERAEMMEILSASTSIVKNILGAHGVNIGMNLGSAAGAGIPDHLHVHVVPRWQSDTNFMPIIAQTKTISFDLEKMYDRLLPAFQALKI